LKKRDNIPNSKRTSESRKKANIIGRSWGKRQTRGESVGEASSKSSSKIPIGGIRKKGNFRVNFA